MKIALVASPFVQVPPKGYGGTERILQYLGAGLIKLGENVTLFASGDSTTNIPLERICEVSLFEDKNYNHNKDRDRRTKEINKRTIKILERGFDVINIHDYDNPDLIERSSSFGIPVIVSIGHAVTPVIRQVYECFKDKKGIFLHGLSRSQLQPLDPDLPFIYNGIDQDLYEPLSNGQERKDYIFSIGDMKPIKGHRLAIELAKRTGMDLLIAGAPYYPESHDYYEKQLLPNIDIDVSQSQDGFVADIINRRFSFGNGNIIYFGSANDEQKRTLYRFAMFMQFLGNLDIEGSIEACPTTPIESIMSGTPVLGVKGSVTEELIDEGVTGYNVSSLDQTQEMIKELKALQGQKIRETAVRRFSSDIMADNYRKMYKKVLGGYH